MNTDLDSGLITIAGELVDDSWELFEGAPKMDGSAATIALDSRTLAVLRAHRERQAAEREEWNRHAAEERAKGKDTPGWVDARKEFTDVDGHWLHPEKVSEEFRCVYRRVGLPPINLRDLRHCAATLIHARGAETCARSTRRCGTARSSSRRTRTPRSWRRPTGRSPSGPRPSFRAPVGVKRTGCVSAAGPAGERHGGGLVTAGGGPLCSLTASSDDA
ncbi:hypothetical protein [Streptomyces albus]|uniref:hypothetical protein n=1 Tax=Streptomyces albus TaxID=1888 RepID=UPI0033F82275